MNPILRTLGEQAAHKVARKHIGAGAALDPKRGWAMMRDRKVSASTKALAIALGVALTAGLVALEVPLAAVVTFCLGPLGFVTDALVDGSEMILGPILFASMFLPQLVAAADRRNAVLQTAPMPGRPNNR